jgi:methyl-accepting chemotaxis protein
VGVVLISISGILTLAVTRLWGELGGIGVGGTEAMESGWKRFVPWEVESLGDVGALIAIVLVIQAVLSYLRVLLFARMTEDMTLRMRNDAFAAVISLPMGFFDKRSVGDLNSRITVRTTDETGQLLEALQTMNHSLSGIVTEVRNGSDAIATATSQIATGNLDLSGRTEEQASALEETAASMEQLGSTVRQNADNARAANQRIAVG